MLPPFTPHGLPRSRRRDWIGLGVSAILHGAIVVVALGRRAVRPAEDGSAATAPTRQVEMVYLPPAPTPPAQRPQPAPRRPTPPPEPTRDTRPPNETTRPTEPLAAMVRQFLAPREGAETKSEPEETPSDQPEVKKAGPEAAAAPQPQAAPGSMEAEAERIFGQGRNRQPSGPVVSTMPHWSADGGAPDDQTSNCRPIETAPAQPGTPVEYGSAVGRIMNRRTGRPVAGAHLQMIGTPYVAFTDNTGRYEFRFDLSLVRNCRTQYVWVSAPGFERQRLTLVVGRNVTSDDVFLNRQ